MKILLIYPKYPDTYWSFKHALKFISKKAAVPPLGLITVSAMLPENWQKKLVDLNVEVLKNEDLEWADYVFLSSMYVQKKSVSEILARCKEFSKKVIAGGPLFTQEYDNYTEIDHFILNEAEITLPLFLSDMQNGTPLKRIYRTDEYADLILSPVPDFHLLNLKAYASMNLQVSRGCPFSCDFCEITALLGHKVRMKSNEQIINELDALFRLKWRGGVSVVDDNFIGNKKIIKNELLPSMTEWMNSHNYPFSFNAQTSINLADDDRLLTMMREAGFTSTFIGIETPEEESLHSCHKIQNENRNLLENVKQIQKAGLQVSGGFIVGFDSDTSSVFQRQIDFIQKSGIVSAMVGLLNAPKNTRLYKQMEEENRLTVDATGSNTDFTMNFIPKMDNQKLQEGYQYIINNIYKEKPYYKRIRELFQNYKPVKVGKSNIDFTRIKAFFKSIFILGMLNKGRFEYWKFIVWTLVNKPKLFIDAITFAVYGYHFRTVYGLRQTRHKY
ncbi:B12-binding domain-containing radical SAM protein [Maribellus maritimus]|uniref:B12-binding domain-containing radical SAM protein n=1 Tax=Maribellus maritimus TaxID=2870838 RepID=UPI001EECDCF3|nr:B12-binding domain-containing radical SAM protein [Maribellus maritimus]MCG6191094.1 B12-binding domain-containing radical SAM protein [Maribellus maritimus]